MCLILFAWNPDHEHKLVVAANRDEFYHRPSRAAHFWDHNQNLLAGQDLQQQGTWLGITRTGRFAAVTNFRRPDSNQYPHSRGRLTTDFLSGNESPERFWQDLQPQQEQFAGFNLLIADHDHLWYGSNRSETPPRALEPGIYGLSNHLLNSDWPKVNQGIDQFSQTLDQGYATEEEREQALLDMLRSETRAAPGQLPDTGVGQALEELLSPMFIRSAGYGTRASTLLQIDQQGGVRFVEQNYDSQGNPGQRMEHSFKLET